MCVFVLVCCAIPKYIMALKYKAIKCRQRLPRALAKLASYCNKEVTPYHLRNLIIFGKRISKVIKNFFNFLCFKTAIFIKVEYPTGYSYFDRLGSISELYRKSSLAAFGKWTILDNTRYGMSKFCAPDMRPCGPQDPAPRFVIQSPCN